MLRRPLLAIAIALMTAVPATAAPAMWRISDGDSQVFLFGSMHLLPAKAAWRTPAFNKALKGSDLVYFETGLEASARELKSLYGQYGFNHDGRNLSDYLSKSQRRQLGTIIDALGLNRPALELMRPWLAAMTLGDIASSLGGGIKASAGVEDSLAREIPNRKERGFDSFETQVRVLADMSDKAQVAMLMEVIGGKKTKTPADQGARLVKAWFGGDIDTIYRILASEIGKPGSERFNLLLTNRNKRWAAQIGKLLASDKDVMVIVGAGHFGGPTGLPTLLAKQGLKVERVQ